MVSLKTFLKSAAVGAVMALPIAASATTVIPSAGSSYDITSDNLFIGAVTNPGGGAGSYFVNFYTLPPGPLSGTANASVTVNVLGTFTDLTMSWVDAEGALVNTVLATGPVAAPLTVLTTLFSGDSLSQNLVFSWTDSTAGVGFDFDVSAVPVPAAGLLLLTALGGLGITRRRRKAA